WSWCRYHVCTPFAVRAWLRNYRCCTGWPGRLGLDSEFGQQLLVTLGFKLVCQFRTTALHNATGDHDVNVLRLDVIEQSLVVGDQNHTHTRMHEIVHAFGNNAQGVDIKAGVRLIEYGNGWLEQ